MHGKQHQYRVQATVSSNCRSEGCECEEGSVTTTHNDCRHGDDCYHNQHHSHGAEAQIFGTVNQGADRAHGNQALCKGLTCYDKGDYVCHLHAQAVEEGLDIVKYFLAVTPSDKFAAYAHEKTNEHCHNDVHFDGGNPQGAEGQNQGQGDNRKDCVPQRSVVGFVLNFFNFHRLYNVAFFFIHIFLGEVVECAYNYESQSYDGNLVVAPVDYRVNASHFCGVNSTGVTGAPVKAQGSSYCCSCRKTAYAQTNQDGEHGNHQKHCQAGSTIDAQTDEHAGNPGTCQNKVRGFQSKKGFNG